MKDLLNKKLKVGDRVLLLTTSKIPSLNNTGIVVGFTNKTIRVETEWRKMRYKSWNSSLRSYRKPCSWVNKYSNHVIKL